MTMTTMWIDATSAVSYLTTDEDDLLGDEPLAPGEVALVIGIPGSTDRTVITGRPAHIHDLLVRAVFKVEAAEAPTYKIIRFHQDDRPSEVITRGLTLAQAQAHCRRPDTRGADWFDGYESEQS